MPGAVVQDLEMGKGDAGCSVSGVLSFVEDRGDVYLCLIFFDLAILHLFRVRANL